MLTFGKEARNLIEVAPTVQMRLEMGATIQLLLARHAVKIFLRRLAYSTLVLAGGEMGVELTARLRCLFAPVASPLTLVDLVLLRLTL